MISRGSFQPQLFCDSASGKDISKKCYILSCKIINPMSDAKFKLFLSRIELGPKYFQIPNYSSGEGSDMNECVVKEHAVYF